MSWQGLADILWQRKDALAVGLLTVRLAVAVVSQYIGRLATGEAEVHARGHQV